MRTKLSQMARLLSAADEDAKGKAAMLAESQRKEEEAVVEINRRAVQQAKLRETIKELERGLESSRYSSGETLAMQARVSELQDRLRKTTVASEQDKLEFLDKRLKLEKEVSRANEEIGALRKQLASTNSNNSDNTISSSSASAKGGTSSPAQLYALQDKVDKQLVDIIRLKTELTQRERVVLQHTRQLEEQSVQATRTEQELFECKRALASALHENDNGDGQDDQGNQDGKDNGDQTYQGKSCCCKDSQEEGQEDHGYCCRKSQKSGRFHEEAQRIQTKEICYRCQDNGHISTKYCQEQQQRDIDQR
jgi:hypothetical protein